MEVQCYPIAMTPGTTALLRDFADPANAAEPSLLRRWYPTEPFGVGFTRLAAPELGGEHRERLANLLKEQADVFDAGDAARKNIERLREGAAAVVTGQQVVLFGGPLYVLLKAATAIRKAADATARTGRQHVPVFWLATEDHDLAEVDQIELPTKTEIETIKLGLNPGRAVPVGGIQVHGGSEEDRAALEAALDRASELIAWGPVADLLRESYGQPGTTLAQGFGRLLSAVFAEFGLVVMDASGAGFHALGAEALRAAVEQSAELEAALLTRSRELEQAGYHAQVLVTEGHSLLFLLDADSGVRQPLRRTKDGGWKAGTRAYTTDELLAVLETAPERLSPNALLRPVFQDTILPTAAYVGGPAEIAYFAQSAVVYQEILGRVTPVIPRFSATLVDPAIANVMTSHELQITDVWDAKNAEALAKRLGARAMPIEGKRKLAAAGNALDEELTALTGYMTAMSAELGRAANVSASKMRYQMNRLRTMAANFQVQREASLRKHANAVVLSLLPKGHLQERVSGAVWFMARYGDELPALLVENAAQECPGHRVIYL